MECLWRVSITFTKLSQCVTTLDGTDLHSLEKFVVVMSDRPCADNLFAHKQRPHDATPSTQSALRLHSKRTACQEGITCGQVTHPWPVTKSPGDWGWSRQCDTWKIHWTDIPSIAAGCQGLTATNHADVAAGRTVVGDANVLTLGWTAQFYVAVRVIAWNVAPPGNQPW